MGDGDKTPPRDTAETSKDGAKKGNPNKDLPPPPPPSAPSVAPPQGDNPVLLQAVLDQLQRSEARNVELHQLILELVRGKTPEPPAPPLHYLSLGFGPDTVVDKEEYAYPPPGGDVRPYLYDIKTHDVYAYLKSKNLKAELATFHTFYCSCAYLDGLCAILRKVLDEGELDESWELFYNSLRATYQLLGDRLAVLDSKGRKHESPLEDAYSQVVEYGVDVRQPGKQSHGDFGKQQRKLFNEQTITKILTQASKAAASTLVPTGGSKAPKGPNPADSGKNPTKDPKAKKDK